MKRFLSVLCVLAMLLSIVPVAAFAAAQDLQALIDAGADEPIVLEADASNITVTRDTYVDLNGHDIDGVTVLNGTLYCLDSQTADYTVADGVYGHVTGVTGAVKAAEGYLQAGDSFHAVNLDIYAMTLRAADVGVYYKSNFAADEIVAAQVESFGVALSVVTAPNAENLDSYCGYSVFEGFEAGEGANAVGTSTLLKGIMKATNGDNKNAKNAAMPIYGRAYIKTAEGYIFGETVKRSLQQQVEAIDGVWTSLTDAQKAPVLGMLEAYTSVMEGWNIPNIKGGEAGEGAGEITVPVEVATENGVVTETVTVEQGAVSITVPAGVKLSEGANKLTLTVTPKETSDAGLTLEKSEVLMPMDVHVEGLAADNAQPITIYLGKIMPENLNMGNYTVYHVENGKANEMILIPMDAEFTAHNQYKYSLDGELTLYMATFSEVAIRSTTTNTWNGNLDYTWYTANPNANAFEIRNADQLAAFGAIVGGMKVVTDRNDNGTYTYSDDVIQNSFAGKTVKLLADIDLGDAEAENDENKIFYPIGYYNSDLVYEKTSVAITSGLRNFEGTFDGNGHTVSNFYHNTWEMKGDHNWYDGSLQYYRDGMGLFGKVYGGTVKNLTVANFSSDGEIATTGVIAAYADGATFENIAIFDCNPRVYNIGNGGIVGCVGWYAKEPGLTTTFANITVDNSNKISALWGSYDVACGGIVGQYYPTSGQESSGTPKNGGIELVNCHVSAQMDVYNDVCANYQYYAYRYAGMLIGSVRENVTIDGHSYPKMDGITASGCTVHFGDWNDYYYCELVANTTASYTHDHQMSRLEQIAEINVGEMKYLPLGATEWANIPTTGRVNYVVVKAKDANGMWIHGDGHDYAECYHFVDGKVWNHEDAGYHNDPFIDENKDGEADLLEDKQLIYREFNNLVTGYGWGVTSRGFANLNGVTNLDVTQGNEESVEKFAKADTAKDSYTTGAIVTIGELFEATGAEIEIIPETVMVAVSPVGETSTAGGTYTKAAADANGNVNWTEGTLTFSGFGAATITITDYYFCTPTVLNVTIEDKQNVVKFDDIFPSEDSLHRVGNHNAVTLGQLFKEMPDVEINSKDVNVEIETIYGATGVYTDNDTWTSASIKFNGTGIVKVKITDNDHCETTELILEVVDAENVTTAASATTKNIVLLNDIGSGFTVSGDYSFYGNGFTLNYTDNGAYLNNGLTTGIVNIKENGTLDNLRIKASIYPVAYMYHGYTAYADYVQGGPYDESSNGKRYYYQLSGVAASDNATISNCYIYGARNNIFVGSGNVSINDTILECGTVANLQIQSTSEYVVTLENVTTIQSQVNPTLDNPKTNADDTNNVSLGAGIILGPDMPTNPKITLNGYFKQYNWVTSEDASAVSNDMAEEIITAALGVSAFNHTINGKKASNLGIIDLTGKGGISLENNTGLPYEKGSASISGIQGEFYSLKNATPEQIYSDAENANRNTINGLYHPQFKYSADLGGQLIPEEVDDQLCYREGDVIYLMFPEGSAKEFDIASLVEINKYSGQDLGIEITCKDSKGSAMAVNNGKITLTTAGEYTITYKVTDSVFFDEEGNKVTSSVQYSWNVILSVSLKNIAVHDAYFEFDSDKQKMGYYSYGDLYQCMPFLAGLKIYDYNGETPYLRFDGDSVENGYNRIASIVKTEKDKYIYIDVTLTDGGVLSTKFYGRADKSGGSGYTGSIKVYNNSKTIYYVPSKGTSNSADTTTNCYWDIHYYRFVGNNGVQIESDLIRFNSQQISRPSGSFSTSIKYTVTYDANGGNCGQNTGYATSVNNTVTLPTPTRSGYIFRGWNTKQDGAGTSYDAGATYTPAANITLYAQWGKAGTVTYDANGGSCGTASEKYTGTALTLPTPTRDDYWFVGWYDAAEGGKKIGDAGAAYHADGSITLYAHWQEAISYTVTYNPNGGTCGTTSAVYEGTALTLPDATLKGYTFLGWYTESGEEAGAAGKTYSPSANVTLYAQWEQISYTITISKQDNATVTVDKTTAHYNDTVSVTVSFTQNNSKTLTVKDASGNTVLSKSAAGTYTFTMPASNVTIEASSSGSCVTPDTLVTLADGTQKEIQFVKVGDKVLVWNFYTGAYDVAPVTVVFNHGTGIHRVLHLKFDDDTVVKVIADHGFYDISENNFVFIEESNVESYVGHEFVKQNGTEYATAKLVEYYVVEEYTTAYAIFTYKHLNCILEGMFTITPTVDDDNFYMPFEMAEGMKYDEEKMQADIEKYGLYTYEDFDHVLTYEQFIALNIEIFKVSVGKGLITYEKIVELIQTYIPQ